MTLGEIEKLVTVRDMHRAMDKQVLTTLTMGDDVLLQEAVKSACRWAFSAILRCGSVGRGFTADRAAVLGAAVQKMAVYELYARSEVEAGAADKRDDAKAMLKGLLGDCVDTDGRPKPFVGAVRVSASDAC